MSHHRAFSSANVHSAMQWVQLFFRKKWTRWHKSNCAEIDVLFHFQCISSILKVMCLFYNNQNFLFQSAVSRLHLPRSNQNFTLNFFCHNAFRSVKIVITFQTFMDVYHCWYLLQVKWRVERGDEFFVNEQ